MTRKRWEDVEFSAIVQDGAFGPRFSGEHYADDGNIATLRTTDISTAGTISYDTMPLARLDESKFANHFLERGDIVISRSGRIGTTAFFDSHPIPVLPGAFLLRFRLRNVASPRFYTYWFNSPVGQQRIMSVARGAAQQNINLTNVLKLKVPFPPMSDQEATTRVLSTYDDLIENNRRRIQLLEQAARLLYKEWFVHLRFPGHEHVKITDGVPEGWEKKPLTEVAADVSYGLTASSTTEEIGPKFLRITDIVPTIIEWDRVPFCEADDQEIQQNRLEIGDVVVARTGATVGCAKRISHLPADVVYASYLVRFRFDDPEMSLIAGIYMESTAYKEFVKNHAGGAAQPNANAKVLGSAPLLVPTCVLRQQLAASVTPLINQRDLLVTQNERLARARDLLLPRLMNGEIPV